MAKIVWTKRAECLFFDRVEYAYTEFGKSTSLKWQIERKRIEHQLLEHPESYTPERLLSDKRRLYRSCHIMRRFKLVHYYAKTSDTVYITDIWDMRMSPDRLMGRIK